MPDPGRIRADFGRTSSRKQTSAPAFEAHDVYRQFRLERHTIDVLTGVRLEVQRGEWVALVGRSGSGKTTLLQLLGSLDKPTHGELFCHGRAYSRLSGKRKAAIRRDEIGFVFQSHHLFPELNAVENVALPALHWGWDRAQAAARARELLCSFGLEERLDHRPQELSGGEQQRVAVARALINSPNAILADEPTGNLDVTAGKEIVGILQRLHAEQGKTIVMVTHDLAIAKLADRVLLMQDGIAQPFEKEDAFPSRL